MLRYSLIVVAVALAFLLAIPAFLTPDASGLGTHRQLGLPPCTWVLLTGYRCPTCGMTTSWAWMARGDLKEALTANPAGVLLFFQTAISVPFLLWLSAIGDTGLVRRFGVATCFGLVTIVAIALGYWAIRLKLG